MSVWEPPRRIKIKCKIGQYYGPSDRNAVWQNILTDIGDFSPIVFPSTPFTNRMEAIFKETKWTDVKILCQDGVEVQAHKSFLMGSPYFSACFKYALAKEDGFMITNIHSDSRTVKTLVLFLYSGRIEGEDVNWSNLFRLAMYCQLTDLAHHCQLQIMSKVRKNMQDLKALLRFAVKFHARKLKIYLVFLCRNIQRGLD